MSLGLLKIRDEAKKKADLTAQEVLNEYDIKADEFVKTISKTLDRINEEVTDVKTGASNTLNKVVAEHNARVKMEETKTDALDSKKHTFQESSRTVAFELNSWIRNILSEAEKQHADLSRRYDEFKTKLEELKRNTPEEHLRKAEEHKSAFELSRSEEERELRRFEEHMADVNARIENERRAANAQMEMWCSERQKGLERSKRELLANIEARNREIMDELTKAAIDLGIVER